MTQRALSRPQRAMLANAIAGRPLEQGVPRPQPFGPHSTVQALHRKGMLAGINHVPTAAGHAALDRDLQENLDRIAPDKQVSNNEAQPT